MTLPDQSLALRIVLDNKDSERPPAKMKHIEDDLHRLRKLPAKFPSFEPAYQRDSSPTWR
ncbi:hypothetical protein [Novipirellula rosea]|uniref:Uncharacterized protein n=1 Tax=Novipirellula rosea TaxID=1031540 RepID=A0ABP8NGW4_9BACT